jgi:hypothetical protein
MPSWGRTHIRGRQVDQLCMPDTADRTGCSASSRSMTGARQSITARRSVMISRDAGAGPARPASLGPARPGPVAGGPVRAVVGGDRVDPVAQLGTEADQADPVPHQRAELAHLRGAFQASGSRSARSSCAKIAAPALVVFQPRRGDRLAPQRVHHVRVEAVVLQRLGRMRPRTHRGSPEGRSPVSRRNGSEPFTTFPVQLHLAVLGDHRHLGALAMRIDSDVNRHCRVSRAWNLSPGASCNRAELGRGPALIGS